VIVVGLLYKTCSLEQTRAEVPKARVPRRALDPFGNER
jgi:hypothetical protein